MINPHRGEVALVVDGQERCLRLTLGALAALEAQLASCSLADLVKRFEDGSFSSVDLIALLCAGLNGGGWSVSQSELGQADIEGGPIAAACAGARLLSATFASDL